MKKFFMILAAAAVLPLFAACNSEENPSPSSVSVSPTSVNFKAEGETLNVVVTTEASDIQWSGKPEWLTITLDGKALVIVAAANTSTEARSCTLTVTAGGASVDVPVTQEGASKYPGYTEISLDEAAYTGDFMKMFYSDMEGGMHQLSFTLDARNTMYVVLFTEVFADAASVELTEGNYTLGNDFTGENPTIVGKPKTFARGMVSVVGAGTEEEELIQTGSYIATNNGETETYTEITGGSIEVSSTDEGKILIKMDFTTADSTLKYYYEGDIDIDSSLAFISLDDIPTEDID